MAEPEDHDVIKTANKYMLDEERNPLPVDGLIAWAKWFEEADRIVNRTSIGPVNVSTVFLGMDHGFAGGERPILFETMLFFEEDGLERSFSDGDMERTCTWIEAEQAHERWCAIVRSEATQIQPDKETENV